ncbi:MAG: Na/Pi cotransporter family protein [Ruminococcus sp.]|nr:Na/Pi cotransporter family protein [Ruminococcus sp.]
MKVIMLVGGLALFLYGMNVMSEGLEKLAGGKLEGILKRMTSNKIKAFLLGMGVTCVIQSSSAVTVMLVGLVNSGIMHLSQTIGVLMGSNVGTTITAWLLSTSAISGDSFAMKMLKPENFSMVIALIGIILIMFSKSSKKKDIGSICLGFTVLMQGMEFMSEAVAFIGDNPDKFKDIITKFDNPILGVIIGAVFTGIIQSSSASVGILQALSLTGIFSYGFALPIIMGQNIGTCVTALISSVGVNKDARRVAVVHVCFNCIGTLVWLPVVLILKNVIGLPILDETVGPVGIATMHTIFNVLTTAMLLPLSNFLVKLAYKFIKQTDEERKVAERNNIMLDERLLKTPAVAVEVCRSATLNMAEITKTTIIDALQLLNGYDEVLADKVVDGENTIDNFEDKLNGYLVKISKSSITSSDSRTVSKMMHTIGNLERISDHAVNLAESAKEVHEKQLSFSNECQKEIRVISEAIIENINKAFEAYTKDDVTLAHKVEPLEELVDALSAELKNRHIARLQNDECTVELGYIYQDILTNLERISDHCSNIAGCLIEIEEKTNIHEYLHDIRENDEDFRKEYHAYCDSYFNKLGVTK